MLLNKLFNVARSSTNIHQLSNFLQRCSISTTASIQNKLTTTNSLEFVNLKDGKNPIENVNNHVKNNEAGRLFAVVQICGKQFKITQGDVVMIEGHWEPTNGDVIRLEKVLLCGSQDFTIVGRPIVEKGLVDVQATVIEKSLSHTRTHFKFKKRKQYRRINFQRSLTTVLRINSIDITRSVEQHQEKTSTNVFF